MPFHKVAFGLVLFALGFTGCSRDIWRQSSSESELNPTVGATLDKQLKGLSPQAASKLSAELSYLALFKDETAAQKHSLEATKAGATVNHLSGGRILKVTGDHDTLSQLSVQPNTAITLNVPVRWTLQKNGAKSHSSSQVNTGVASGANSRASDQTPGQKKSTAGLEVSRQKEVGLNTNTNELIESFWTARKITGVEELLKRFPNADGRGLKVAVFDTGIDFGVEGVFKGSDQAQKLVGFYDLVGYGRVGTSPLEIVSNVAIQWIDQEGQSRSLKINRTGSEAITPVSAGVLDEAKAARGYLSSQIDINDNESYSDQFLFVVMKSADEKLAVWIDANLDGEISAAESITDFNTTFQYLDTRKEVAPSGARPIAVTILNESEVQFHTVPEGHGTSCGMIIAGDGYANGRLRGMAPAAKLLSYALDIQGQDVYSIDQLLEMFLHAKAQQVDAISISWGFSTADLISARFVGEFIDQEISSAGILVAIAAGNEGPGVLSAAADDYIPRNGYGIGALLTPEQARNVYRWTGADKEAVIFYSSQGPTRGGRLIPDLVSPLMTWVRGQRATAGPQFEGFGGTSSATPAFVGSVSALISALKQNGYEKIDQRILKLALQRSARKLENAQAFAQGAGVVQVHLAYDWYVKLIEELKSAKADTLKRTPFAYDLRPRVLLKNHSETPLEGIILDEPITKVEVQVGLAADTQQLIDPLVSVEPVLIQHSSSWIQTPEMLPIQISGNKFVVSINPEVFQTGRIYSDVIELVRPVDGVVLARIPVLVRSPMSVNSQTRGSVISMFQEIMGAEDSLRFLVELKESNSIIVEGLLRELSSNVGARLGVQIYNSEGVVIFSERVIHSKTWENIKLQTPVFAAGKYEVTVYRTFARPAKLGKIDFTGMVRLPALRIMGRRNQADQSLFALSALEDLDFNQVKLEVQGYRKTTTLSKNAFGRFEGDLQLTLDEQSTPSTPGMMTAGLNQPGSQPVKELTLKLVQDPFDRAMQNILHCEVVLIDTITNEVVYRGWVNQQAAFSGAGSEISLTFPVQSVRVLVYPNIVKWIGFSPTELSLEALVGFEKSVQSEIKDSAIPMRQGETRSVQFFPNEGEKFPTSSNSGTDFFGSLTFSKEGQSNSSVEVIRF